MQSFPHHYPASARGEATGNVIVSAKDVPDITTAAPAEFGGPGDEWSPEALLVAAVADCFILTFRAIARASTLEWSHLRCDVVGVLDKVERVTQFTEFQIMATLEVPADTDRDKAERLLERAEKGCLITNSLMADTHLTVSVNINNVQVDEAVPALA